MWIALGVILYSFGLLGLITMPMLVVALRSYANSVHINPTAWPVYLAGVIFFLLFCEGGRPLFPERTRSMLLICEFAVIAVGVGSFLAVKVAQH